MLVVRFLSSSKLALSLFIQSPSSQGGACHLYLITLISCARLKNLYVLLPLSMHALRLRTCVMVNLGLISDDFNSGFYNCNSYAYGLGRSTGTWPSGLLMSNEVVQQNSL